MTDSGLGRCDRQCLWIWLTINKLDKQSGMEETGTVNQGEVLVFEGEIV